MDEDNEGGAPSGAADTGADTHFRALAGRVANTADADLKEFLSGILKATETTLADLSVMRERLDKTQASADAATVAAKNARKDASETAVRADIRAEAHAAGAVDAGDVLPFISLNDVKLGDDGKSNIGELISGLKKLKPYLFGKANTSASHAAPRPGKPVPRSALEMTPGEYRMAKTRFTRR